MAQKQLSVTSLWLLAPGSQPDTWATIDCGHAKKQECLQEGLCTERGPSSERSKPQEDIPSEVVFFRVKNYSKLVDRVCHGFRKVSNKVGDGKAFMH